MPREERRRLILKAAVEIFSEKGYYKARISDIAARANMGHGTVYRFFHSKRELATEVIGARGATGFLQAFDESSFDELGPEEFFKAIGEKYLGNLRDRLPAIRFSIAEGILNEEIAVEYNEKLLQTLFGYLSKFVTHYQEKGFIKERDPYLLGHIFYNMLFGFLYSHELMYGNKVAPIDREKMLNEIVDVFLHGVLDNDKEDKK